MFKKKQKKKTASTAETVRDDSRKIIDTDLSQ